MCRSSGVTATVVRIVKDGDAVDEPLTPSSSNGADVKDHEAAMDKNQMTIGRTVRSPFTFPPSSTRSLKPKLTFRLPSSLLSPKLQANTLPVLESNLDSSAADNLAWTHFSSPSTTAPLTASRMTFHTLHAAKPLAAVVQQAQQLASSSSSSTTTANKALIVITGRGRRFADRFPCHSEEVTSILASQGHNPSTGAEMRKTLGDVVTSVVVAGPSASLLVVQAGGGQSTKALEG